MENALEYGENCHHNFAIKLFPNSNKILWDVKNVLELSWSQIVYTRGIPLCIQFTFRAMVFIVSAQRSVKDLSAIFAKTFPLQNDSVFFCCCCCLVYSGIPSTALHCNGQGDAGSL